jgi:hypothetical protein
MVGSVLTATGCSSETGTGGEGGTSASSTTGGMGGEGTGGMGTGGMGTGGAGGSAAMELTCDYYCNSIDGAMGACTGDANDQYANNLTGACMATCATFTEGKLGETSGNTLGCRIYHADVASMSAMNATSHCPHAGPFGDDTCGERCDVFCSIAEKVCTGNNAAFADKATCMTECAAFAKDPKYSVTNTASDTFGCRAYHLTAAAIAPDMHCAHIKTMSDTCK